MKGNRIQISTNYHITKNQRRKIQLRIKNWTIWKLTRLSRGKRNFNHTEISFGALYLTRSVFVCVKNVHNCFKLCILRNKFTYPSFFYFFGQNFFDRIFFFIGSRLFRHDWHDFDVLNATKLEQRMTLPPLMKSHYSEYGGGDRQGGK